jgi:putative peptidoglycan lipid II flippase
MSDAPSSLRERESKNAEENVKTMEKGSGRSTLSTVLVMTCTAASRLFGYVKLALIGAFFGASGSADALNAVFNIPNNLRKLFAEGALSSAFIPVLSSTIVEEDRERSRTLVKNLFALQVLIIVPLVALSLVFPNVFIRLLLVFPDAEKLSTAGMLLRWMFNYIFFVSIGAVIMAALNCHGRFAVPALSPLVFSLAIVLSIILLRRSLGVASMGIGVLIGGILQLFVQIPSFLRQGYSLGLDFRFNNPDFIKTLKLWVPYLVSASIFALNQIVATLFASGLEDGSASAITNSIIFLQIPIGIFGASVMTVVFPKMSRQAAHGDTEGLRESVKYGVEFLTVLLVPSAVLLCLLGKEVISVTLQRQNFNAENTFMTARMLTGYSIGLLSMGVFNFFQRFFYSLKEFKTPILSGLLVAVIDIIFSLFLKETKLRVTGLAVANSIAFTVGVAYLAAAARARLVQIGGKRIVKSFLKSIAASAPMAAVLLLFTHFKADLWSRGSSVESVLGVAAVVVAAIGITLGMYVILRVPFIVELWRLVKRRAK